VPVTPRLSVHRLSGTPSQTSKEAANSPSTPSSTTPLSSRYSAPLQFAPSVSNPMPRFGTTTPCPGCSQSVSPMERGVVPGPQGQRWHSSCLVCGGKQAKGRGGRRVNGQPGCRKQLDSSAKRDTGAGGVWCRDCLVSSLSIRVLRASCDHWSKFSYSFPTSYGPHKHPRRVHPLQGLGSLIRPPVRPLIAFYLNTLASQPLPANLRGCQVGPTPLWLNM